MTTNIPGPGKRKKPGIGTGAAQFEEPMFLEPQLPQVSEGVDEASQSEQPTVKPIIKPDNWANG
jgi:hypothetical protein